MIAKLWCWLFGCKIREKEYTGEVHNGFDMYRWSYLDRCPRCGKKITGSNNEKNNTTTPSV